MKFNKAHEKPVSKLEFANFAGINKSSVTRGVQAGLIIQTPDGLINVYEKKNLEYLRNLLDKRMCNLSYTSPERKTLIQDYDFIGFLLSIKLSAGD